MGNAKLHYNLIVDWESRVMTRLTVTARGQITLRRDVLRHFGIKPGERIELELLPEGQGLVRAARPSGNIDKFIGLLKGRARKMATLEAINEAATRGWAGQE